MPTLARETILAKMKYENIQPKIDATIEKIDTAQGIYEGHLRTYKNYVADSKKIKLRVFNSIQWGRNIFYSENYTESELEVMKFRDQSMPMTPPYNRDKFSEHGEASFCMAYHKKMYVNAKRALTIMVRNVKELQAELDAREAIMFKDDYIN